MRRNSKQLSSKDAVQVWLMRWKGMYQHAIAAHFGVNQGRISEILTGKKHMGSRDVALGLK